MTIVQFEHRDGILDLGWGHPLPSLLPTGAWAAAGSTSLQTYGWKALTYGHGPGPAPLREWIAAHLGDVTAEQTFVTAGTSHGLSLLTQLLTKPGDTVLVDSPTYHYAFPILTDLGVRLFPVRADDPDDVARRAREHRAAFLYVVPTFGNPTGRSLSLSQRQQLASSGLTVVEDDPYRELYYSTPEPPLFFGPNVIRLGSFSKTVAPGLRLGWINADPALVDRLARLGSVHSGGGVNHTTALTMAVFGESGAYTRHVAVLRDRYREHRDALCAALAAALGATPDAAPGRSPGTAPGATLDAALGAAPGAAHVPDKPDGGWFLWFRLPDGVDASSLLPVAERHGVSFVPGPAFFVDGQGGSDRVRLSFSRLPPDDLAEAARRLISSFPYAV